MCLKESCFPYYWKSHRWSLYLRMLGKGLPLKTTALLVFFLWLVKSLKNLQIIKFTGLMGEQPKDEKNALPCELWTLISFLHDCIL